MYIYVYINIGFTYIIQLFATWPAWYAVHIRDLESSYVHKGDNQLVFVGETQ